MLNDFILSSATLRERYDQRPTLDVNDEYDVQDLFHALLTLSFDDSARKNGHQAMQVVHHAWIFCFLKWNRS